MPLSNGKFREKRYNESHALRNGVNKMLPLFPYFLFYLDNIRYTRCTQKLQTPCELPKNGHILRAQTIFIPFLHFYRLIGAQFGIRDLHIMLFSNCEF
jgi:hypothetical protein